MSLYNPSTGYLGAYATETYASYDVSTSISALEATNTGQTAIFNDLGSGSTLASTTVTSASDGAERPDHHELCRHQLPQRCAGSQVAMGGAITTLVGTTEQAIFGYSGTTSLNTLVLTYATASTGDWYSITVPAAGSILSLSTSTPADGSGEFENSLAPHIQLFDPSGNLVATGVVGPDGRNETINYTSLLAGAYHIQVTAKNGTQGEYFLSLGTPLTETIPANATEGVGTVNGTVSIPVALTTPLTVSLASSDNTRATVPATVTIAVGQTSAVVPITITNTGLLDAPEAVTITASAPGCLAAVGTIQIHSGLTATLSVSLPASAAENGGSLTGTVTASAAPTQNVTVSLSSNGASHLTVPATVILPAGQASVNFTATLLDDHVIESSPMPVTVAAAMDNWTPGSYTINVLDADATLALALPASGWEGQTLSGTVQIGGTLTAPLLVSLASNMTSQLSVPATVTIPAGSLSAAFTATLIDNGQRTGPQNVQITATAGGLSSATANVIVDDADVDHYTFSGLPAAAPAGTAFTVTVRAYDVLNNLITVSNATVPLHATGQGGGSLTVSPATDHLCLGRVDGQRQRQHCRPGRKLEVEQRPGRDGHEQRDQRLRAAASRFDQSACRGSLDDRRDR